MSTNVIFMGWDRPVVDREGQSMELFQEFMQFLGGLQQSGTIQSFEPVFLGPHGGDLNGFILIRGEHADLDELEASDQWMDYVTRGGMVLEGHGVVRGATGEMVTEWMNRWARLMPS